VDVDEKLKDKVVMLVFDDMQKPMRITGKVLGYNSNFLIIFSDGKERVIPLHRIIRMEEVVK
jgi:hypothetical protein